MSEFRVRGTKIVIRKGDITEEATEAIVNAANPSLMGGGGVDGAIHRKGGSAILEECKKIRKTEYPEGLPTGEAVITTGGRLKARYVIHTVGPTWRGGKYEEEKFLAKAYENCLRLALAKRIKSIAFPAISTGVYGYPIEKAGKVALRVVKEFVERENKLKEVVFVLFSEKDLEVYERIAKNVFV